MRLSSSEIFSRSVNAMLDQQSRVSKTQLQIASGKRIVSPSDDPTGTVQLVQLQSSIARSEQHQKNINLAEARLVQEESILQDVVSNIQRVRELTLQANSDTQNDGTRGMIAAELRQRLDELLQLSNTRDANGEYIFAGFKTQAKPFAALSAGGFSYAGDDGQRFLQISATRQIAIGDSGNDVFMGITNGNGFFATASNPANTGTGIIDAGSITDRALYVSDTYSINFSTLAGNTVYEVRDSGGAIVNDSSGAPLSNINYVSGAAIDIPGVQIDVSGEPLAGDQFTLTPSSAQNMFSTYQTIIDELETPRANSSDLADFHNAVNRTLVDMDQALENTLDIRATVGSRLQALDSQREINDGFVLQMEKTQSQIGDLDYAEAISRFQQLLVGLEAAQKSHIQIQGLSLFNFI